MITKEQQSQQSSQIQLQKNWLRDYDVQDLSRTLIRQYLYQNNMFKSLNCFQSQDPHFPSKKINRSIVIKMLSMVNLVINNKRSSNPFNSLLDVLVNYLREKFQNRHQQASSNQGKSNKNVKQFSMNGGDVLEFKDKQSVGSSRVSSNIIHKQKTQQGFYKQKNSIKHQEQKQKAGNVRPSTAKPKNKEKQKTSNVYSKLDNHATKTTVNKNDRQEQSSSMQIKTNNLVVKLTDKPEMIVDMNNINNGQKSTQIGKSAINKSSQRKSSFNRNAALSASNEVKKVAHDNQKKVVVADINDDTPKISQELNMKSQEKIQKQAKKKPQKQQQYAQFFEEKSQIKEKPSIHLKPEQNKVAKQNYQIIQEQSEIKDQSITLKKNIKQQNIVEDYQEDFNVEQQKKPQQKPKLEADMPQPQGCNASVEVKEEQPKFQKINTSLKSVNVGGLSNRQSVIEDVELPEASQKEFYAKKNESTLNKKTSQTAPNDIKQFKEQKEKKQNKFVKQEDQIIEETSNNYVASTIAKPTRMMRKIQKKPQQETVKGSNEYKPTSENNNKVQQTQQKVDKTTKNQENNKKQQTKDVDDFFQVKKQKPNQIQGKPSALQNQNNQNMIDKLGPVVPSQGGKPLMKLKKKQKQTQEQNKYASKFKFDDNFVDQPLHAHLEKYQYEPFSFTKMTIKPELKPKNSNIVLENTIDYTQKPVIKNVTANNYAKKKNQKNLSTQKASELKKIVYQQGNSVLPKAWHQGFILSPHKDTPYGLKQIEGGPCGIIAAVQCYFLKHLMYFSKPTSQQNLCNQTRRQICLMAALTDILWKSKTSDKITLIIPSNRNFSGTKLDFSNLIEVEVQAETFQMAYENIWNYKTSFVGQSNHGVIIIIYSIIMTKGIENIYNQVDMKENPLIGHHGHCTQELVNLFICGQASSNCFDGKKQLDEGFTLHGIEKKSQFGFMTVFETLEYIEVGKNLKNPIFPIWIICKQFHYHVTFANHYLIAENNDCEKFDLVYFDGLYACQNYIRLTFDKIEKDQFGMIKQTGDIKKLPLIEQVLLKKWGKRKADWNGSIKIL